MQFDVVLVPFPFDDLSSSKVRPAVCLTNPIGQRRHVTVSFITSAVVASPEPSDLVLDPADPDFAATGLRVHSTLRIHRMVTIGDAIIQRKLGSLSPRLQQQVRQKLRALFTV